MRFEKITIDGQTYYRELPDEKSTKREETKTKGREALGKIWQTICDIAKKGMCLINVAHRAFSLVGKKECGSCEMDPPSQHENDALFPLLPHMDEEGRHKVYLWLMESPEHLGGSSLSAMLSYFSAEERDALYLRFVPHLSEEESLACAKLTSEECLHNLVNGYLEGKYHDIHIRSLYPYLSKEDIERLFDHLAKE